MATIDFLPFAGAAGSNVLSQSAYAALAARTAGFSSGIAKSSELNKVWRQSSIMSAALAQVISDNTGADVIDDGTTASIVASLKLAIRGRLLNVQTFTSSGTYTPTPGTNRIKVRAIGGGGSGGGVPANSASQLSVSSGGASGSWAEAQYTSGFSSGVTVTIGAGGIGVANGGNAGGTTSFGGLLICPGGGFGGIVQISNSSIVGISNTGPSGAGVTGSGIVHSTQGSIGSNGQVFGTAGVVMPGFGGLSPFGCGGTNIAGAAGGNASGRGAGGGGTGGVASAAAFAGGNGSSGIVIVEEYS